MVFPRQSSGCRGSGDLAVPPSICEGRPTFDGQLPPLTKGIRGATSGTREMDAAVTGGTTPYQTKSHLTWSGSAIAFLIFFIIAFPKGGIKIGNIPLTIGYIMTALLLFIAFLRGRSLSFPLDRTIAFGVCLLLTFWSAVVVGLNGTKSFGFTMSYFVSAIYLPFFGLLFLSGLVLDEHHQKIERALVWAIRFIVLYGIFLFIFRQATGHWIEVPYITVNADDVGSLDDKHINRGGIFKLISTYNNGNIFGVSMAIVAPLYLKLESKNWMRVALYLALFLTLSRTVWIAALLILSLRSLSKGIRPLTILYLAAGFMLASAVIGSLLSLLGVDLSFVFDRNLGGRLGQLDILEDVHLLPSGPTDALPEIVYLGMLKYFGIPGLLLFLAHLLITPLLLWLEGVPPLSTSRASACMQGLLIYCVLAGADAAYSFIPVMMIFWIVAGLGFWYAHRQA
jgi:hypothetical protein